PVDVLVNLAQEGEIDPWDIDIVRVTDKFLERIEEGDLGRSGRAILYASILLRMKSDYLVEEEEEDEEEEEEELGMSMMMGFDDHEHDDEFVGDDPIDRLEQDFERRMKRKNVRERSRPNTLDELIRELRERERGSWWKEKREYDTSQPEEPATIAPHHTAPEPTTEDAMSTAHKDDMEARIDEVWATLSAEFEARDELLYRELVANSEGDDTKSERVIKYLSLLFLAHRGKIELEQDEFYGDLWVKEKKGSS
ncbi:MAG: ScpA family protein, partial [Halobacteria archaeon]|nr:ScpA family protein [Halobacteria archaeon]